MLKFFRILIAAILTILLLAGCEAGSTFSKSNSTTEKDETKQDYSKLFELNIYSDKQTYKTTDKIKIWATLKYTGVNNQIKIWHADPYIMFYISDGKDFNIGGIFHTILTSTVLEKEKLYSFNYTKNGGYSADDPKADFWKKFYEEKELYLPEGEYTMKVSTAFSLTEKSQENRKGLSQELKIIVKPDSTNSGTEKSKTAKNGLSLNKDEIQRISISAAPLRFDAFDITGKEQISAITDYLVSLKQIETDLNPKDYLGGGYNIKILLKDETEREFSLYGNMFFMEKDGFTVKIPYEEAVKFDTVVANFLQNNHIKNGEPSVEGTVMSIKAAKSGHNISCVIKDKDNTAFDIYVYDAKIIDATGKGWMILHEKDIIRVFYQKDKQKGNKSVVASAVYIQKAAQ